MTAQIVIANTQGLCFASDSAASIGSFSNNAVQKIFSLPGRQPVAFMVMGSAIHAPSGLTWDRIFYKFHNHFIRTYGEDKELKNLGSYQKEFVKFLNNLTSDRDNEDSLAMDLYQHFTDERNYLHRGLSSTDYTAKEVEPSSVLRDNLLSANNQWEKSLTNVEDKYRFNQVEKYHGQALRIIGKGIVHKILSLDTSEARDDFEDMYDLVAENLCHHLVQYGDDSGWKGSISKIILGGFGKEDEYPSYITLETSSVIKGIENNIVYDINVVDPSAEIHPSVEGKVWTCRVFCQPMAQKTFSHRMTTGMDYEMMSGQEISKVAERTLQDWLHKNGKEEFVKVAGVGANTAEKLVSHLMRDVNLPWVMGNAHWDWISTRGNKVKAEFRNAVDRLSPIELSKLAKHLIENEAIMVSFLRPQKTVDLPVDSCYVTKENGFVWTSLKNIPDSSINPKIYSIKRDGTLFF